MAGILSLSVLFISVCVAAGEDFIELSLTPPGVLKKGDTFTISCRAKEMDEFDVLKTIRTIKNPKTGQDEAITLATNGFVSDDFKNVPRYSATFDYDTNTYNLTITDAQGIDGGSLGCELMGKRNQVEFQESAMEYVTIYVPIDKLEIRSKSSDDQWIPVEDEGLVVMRDSYDDGVECYVEVHGSDVDIKPKVTFTIGDTDGTTYKEVEHDMEYQNSLGDDKQLTRVYRTWYKFESQKPDKSFNDREITCSAKMDEYDAVTRTATLSVQFAPSVACREITNAKLGDQDVRVTCEASMNPAPTASFWTFGEGENQTMLNTGDITEGFSTEQKPKDENKWEFHLVVHKVDASVLQEYMFSVENGLGGPVEKKAKLVEVPETPPPPTTTTTKPNKESDPGENKEIGIGERVGASNALTASISLIFTLVLALCL